MEDRFQRLMAEAGLSEYADAVLASAMDSIRVFTRPVSDESELAIGASRIGGMPDLPPDVEWPVYTDDRAQHLELEEMAREEAEMGYPTKGMAGTERSEFMKKRDAMLQDHGERIARMSADGLPPNMVATPLSFIAQFNLSDLERYDTEGLLPHSGVLYFFYDGVDQPWLCETPR